MYGRLPIENKASNMAANGGGSASPTATARLSASALIRRELSKFFLTGVKWTGRPSLGVGAYGSVEPLELNGMACAGKRIHDILVDVGNEGADEIAARFVEECKLMSELRHPHVVQFLGLCLSPSSSLPILVMEHLYCSLDDLLENTRDIPLYMKRTIIKDVALGLAHLHGRHPAIIHRDLTARNVLINNSMRAKLADFGVARILNLPAGKLEATLSRVPGTSTYMPPEVFSREAKYNTAVDIFSFGHLLLFTITQKQPGVEAATFVDSSGTIVARSELERREDSVALTYGLLGREHPFVGIVSECLQTNAMLRPSILQVLAKLEEMRSSVRDPYTRQTRLTLTQMIRKQAAENKKLLAELKTAQEDLLNAKRRIVHLNEKIHRYSQQMHPNSPPSCSESFKNSYYNTADGGFFKDGERGHYEAIRDDARARNLSPAPASNSFNPSPPPPVPTSPRPLCISPEDDHPAVAYCTHTRVENSTSNPLANEGFFPGGGGDSQPLLSLPRTSARHLSKSHDNLRSDPDYERVREPSSSSSSSSRKHSGGNYPRTGQSFAQGFSLADSESDSDFDEFEPPFFPRSPQRMNQLSPKLASLPSSSSSSGALYLTSSTDRANRSNTHPAHASSSTISPPYYQTHQHLRQQTSATTTTSSSSPYGCSSSSSGGVVGIGGAAHSSSSGPRSLSTGPPSLPSSTMSPTGPEGIPRVSVENSHTPDPSSSSSSNSLKPLTTGMAGKIHFYTDLEPSLLLLLQNTDKGRIPGVRYEPETGQVQIESDSSEKTRLASEKFRAAYVYATTNQISVTVDIPGDITESTVEEIISAHIPSFERSTVSYNGLESSLQVLSFSGGELVRLKQAIEEAIQKASGLAPKPSPDGSSMSGNITGRARLSIKRGHLGNEDTDVIVFPNTSNLACKDGVGKAVDDISKGAMLRQCKSFITKHGLLGFGETILMKGGGRLRAKYVIHVNPGVGSSINLESVVRKLVTQALKLATTKSATSISFCPLVSTWTEANVDIAAKTMLEGIRLFVNERKGRKLRDVRIVVRDQLAFDSFSKYAKLS